MEQTKRIDGRAAIRRSARRILSLRYAAAVSAVLTAVLTAAGAIALHGAFSSLYQRYLGGETGAETLLSVLSCLYFALAVIALSPLFLGLVRFFVHLCEEKQEALGQLFFYYSTRESCLFALKTSLGLLGLTLVSSSPLLAAVLFLDRISLFVPATEIAEAWALLLLLLVAAAALSLVIGTGFYLLPYLAVKMPELPFAKLRTISFYAMWGYKAKVLLFQLAFVGWLILSALSFGIVFLFYFLPYWLIANAQFAASICEQEEVYQKYRPY